jgi:myo-inositol-1(or 4)-monophosphatase
MNKIFNIAEEIIEEASKYLLKSLHRKKISYKSGHFNLVTNIDKEVENLIVGKIKKSFPTHTIVAEESGIHKKESHHEWFIDPIDGTTNFAHNYPSFCISIAYMKDSELQIGLVKNPSSGELFSAIKRKGARLNGKKISVSSIKKLSESLLVTGFPQETKKSKLSNFERFKNLTLNTHGVRRAGSAALDLCNVAAGRLEGYWEEKLSPWDVAAGVLILKEAGGKITNYKNGKYDIYSKEILATNGLVHKELMSYL